MSQEDTSAPAQAKSAFEWKPEFEQLLEQIAESDKVDADTEWSLLLEIIKCKLAKNMEAFLTESKTRPSPPPFTQEPSTQGGMKLAPFPLKPEPQGAIKRSDPPLAYMSESEARETLDAIFSQLGDFESAPFTIQRLCELCVNRRQHYTALGKYLRAVEKALLVTSTWNAFPPSTTNGTATNGASLPAASPFATPSASVLNTPLFSPIPFLHEDARRSASRSPPPSPLVLGAATGALGAAPVQTEAGTIEPRALGLVDEMDAPGPGHMSEKPTALSSVTDVPDEDGESQDDDKDVKMEVGRASTPEPEDTQRKAKKPLFSSLKDRFVASTEQKKEDGSGGESMDTEGDKHESKT